MGPHAVPERQLALEVGVIAVGEGEVARREQGDEHFDHVRVELMDTAAEIAWTHHERWDGRGYPRGLAGEAIPKEARLIAVADTYDVITARDSYRKPITVQEAIGELRRSPGGQLDPHIVEVFIGLLTAGDLSFGHGDDADFEAELGFGRRVQAHALPRTR